jgi:hypothetical protein
VSCSLRKTQGPRHLTFILHPAPVDFQIRWIRKGVVFPEYIDTKHGIIGLNEPLGREVFLFRKGGGLFGRDTALAHREDHENPI